MPERHRRRGVRATAVVIASAVLGVAASLGAARVTARPAMLLAAGLFLAAAVATIGVRWAAAGLSGRRRRRVVWATTGAVVVTVGGLCLLLAVPAGDPVSRSAHVVGERYWSLPTGSRLRYVEIPARGARQAAPIVFVHGGPGTPDLAGDTAYFGSLAENGFDVYVYDQLGAGGSARLTHPQQYSRDRDVADLEAIRRAIGAPRLVLIGHSYGATVVAGYLAAYPQRVAHVVVISPGALDPADPSSGGVRNRLDRGQQAALYARLLRPRNLFVYALLQVNPDAAYAVAGDAEMDGQNDRVYAVSEPALHCAGHPPDPNPPTGMGFYRLNWPQSATAPVDADLRPELARNATPALVVKGPCDYLSWTSAVTYVRALLDARLVYLRGGHNLYQDAPGEVMAEIRAFLADRALPIAPYTGTAVPPGFEGPP